MKRILIPTDFSVESLQLVEYAILNYPDTTLEIKLIAGHRLPDTRWGLSHFNEREQIRKHFCKSFREAIRRMELEHNNSIDTFSFQLFTGVNNFAFKNFLEIINPDAAIVPKEEALYCPSSKWFDTTNYIKKNVANVIEVPVQLAAPPTPQKKSLIARLGL